MMITANKLQPHAPTSSLSRWQVRAAFAVCIVVALFLAFYHLTSYPTTWFDEGSHLHVPKTLVNYGVYADRSSEGFRYYGPTIGVGPTVMLPLAASFKLFGVGLLQARVVMALYLLATIGSCYWLARQLGTGAMALTATALLVITPGVALLEYGRQVLGEVPGLFFLFVALALWLQGWENSCWRRLVVVGLFLGLAMVTKSQYLLIIVPSLGLMWLLNLVYYRVAPQRTFVIPGIIAVACAALWQAYLVLYLGPATALENFATLRQASAGAAFVFSAHLMRNSLNALLNAEIYLGALVPALIYGFWLSLPQNRNGQRWSVLYILIVVNLLWYVTASIGWVRYAFLGLALSSVAVAKLFEALTGNFHLAALTGHMPFARWSKVIAPSHETTSTATLLQATGLVWLFALLLLFCVTTLPKILWPPLNAPVAMAAYLDANIPQDALIESWEPEMGFLTNHNYHFPPAALLDVAVGYIWRNGPAPIQSYDLATQPQPLPAYLLVGNFGRWVQLYSAALIAENYELVTSIGGYELFTLRENTQYELR